MKDKQVILPSTEQINSKVNYFTPSLGLLIIKTSVKWDPDTHLLFPPVSILSLIVLNDRSLPSKPHDFDIDQIPILFLDAVGIVSFI